MRKEFQKPPSPHQAIHTDLTNRGRGPLSARSLLIALSRHRWKIILTFLVLASAGFAYLETMPVLYRSEAKLFVRPGNHAASSNSAIAGYPRGRASANHVQSELAILDSYDLTEAVVEAIGLDRVLQLMPADSLESAIAGSIQTPEAIATQIISDAVSIEPLADIITVACTLADPVMAHELLSAYLDLYWTRRVLVHDATSSPEMFREKSDELRNELDAREAELKDFRTLHNLTSVNQQKTSFQRRVDELGVSISDVRVKQSASDARIQSLTAALRERAKSPTSGSISIDNPQVARLRDRLLELQLQEIELDVRYVDSKELRGVRTQIAAVREAMAKLPKTVSRTVAPVQRAGGDFEESLDNERIDAAALEATAASMRTELEQARVRLGELERHESTVAMMTQEIEHLNESYWKYRNNFEEAEIAVELEREKASNIRLIQPANLPTAPISPDREQAAAIILIGALLFGLAVAGIAEYLDDTIRGRHDVEHKLNIPVLATVSAKEFKKCI